MQLETHIRRKEWIEGLTEGHKRAIENKVYNGEKLYSQIKDLAEVDAYYDKIKLDFEDLKLTDQEVIEMLDEIIKDYKIKNIIDFKDKMKKLDAQIPY